MEIWENRRCSIRFHFEVPSGKWQTVMARPVRADKLAECTFPEPVAVAVGAPDIGGEVQSGGLRVGGPTDHAPPLPDAGHRELGRVGVVAHEDEPLVGGQIEDPVGDRLADLGVGEVVDVHPYRLPTGWYSRPLLAGFPATSFIFVSTETTGSPARRWARTWASM
jgi:hypothetical protein